MGDAGPPGYSEMDDGPNIGNLNLHDEDGDSPPSRNPGRGGAQPLGGGGRGGSDGRDQANEGSSRLGPNKARAGKDDLDGGDDEPNPPPRLERPGNQGQGRRQQQPRAGKDDLDGEDGESNPAPRQGRQGARGNGDYGSSDERNRGYGDEDAGRNESGRGNGDRGGRGERNRGYGDDDELGPDLYDYNDGDDDDRHQGRGNDSRAGPRNAMAHAPRGGRRRSLSPRYPPVDDYSSGSGPSYGYGNGPSQMQGRRPPPRIIERGVFVPVPVPVGNRMLWPHNYNTPNRFVPLGDNGCMEFARELDISPHWIQDLEDAGGIFYDCLEDVVIVDPRILCEYFPIELKYRLMEQPGVVASAKMFWKWREGMLDSYFI